VLSKTKTSGTIAWTTNMPALGVVHYGTSPTSLTLLASSGTTTTSGQVTISNLQPRVKYYYQIEVVASDGTKALSSVAEFRTRSR
jgi:chitodextrinase